MKQFPNVPADARELIEKFVDRLVKGEIDHASARCELGLALGRSGHHELSDFDWVEAILDVNFSLRCGWRQYGGGFNPADLDQWPAQELYRAFDRKVPRVNPTWAERFRMAGGQFFEQRMIALRNSEVWNELGNPKRFPDALGYPYPPFAINSGMQVKRVDRKTAMKFGLIDRDTQIHCVHLPPPLLHLDVEIPEEAE